MNTEDNTNLDLLDLDDDTSDSLPEAAFASPRPRRPWLLLSVALIVIALATYIIVRTVGGNSSSSVEIDLDAEPEVVVDGGEIPQPMPQPVPDANPQPLQVPVNEVKVEPQQPAPQPTTAAQPTENDNVRVIEDRREVVFNPNKVVKETQPVMKVESKPKTESKPVAKPEAKKTAQKATAKPAVKKVQTTSGAGWYVQFGSYSSRDAADAAGKKMRAEHSSLFAGKQFVVLASVLKDGRTTYRLRVAFSTSNDANGFCRNAKSDGLDCYVAK